MKKIDKIDDIIIERYHMLEIFYRNMMWLISSDKPTDIKLAILHKAFCDLRQEIAKQDRELIKIACPNYLP